MFESVYAISMVKDEADLIGYTLSHLLSEGINHICIMDNDSTDGTLSIINHLALLNPGSISIWQDHEVAYLQAEKMTWLAEEAHKMGANIILPFDADELVYSWSPRTVAEELRFNGSDVIGIPMWNHFRTSKDAENPNPFLSMTWRLNERNPLDKVAFRWHSGWSIGQGAHQVFDAQGNAVEGGASCVAMRHFPYRSPQQFITKAINGARAYNASNLAPEMGAHWRGYGKMIEEHSEQAGKDWFREHFYYTNPDELMTYDPAPYMQRVIA